MKLEKFFRGVLLASALFSPPLLALGQEIASVSLSKSEVAVGEPLTIRVQLSSPSGSYACGLQVSTGDGKVHNYRIFEEKEASFELVHTYSAPGTFSILVDGKGFIRGLRSTFPCQGTKSVAVAVSSSASGAMQSQCVAPSDEYRSVDCPPGTVGKIVQKQTYTCPGPIASGWTTQLMECKAASPTVSPPPRPAAQQPAAPSPTQRPNNTAPRPIVGE